MKLLYENKVTGVQIALLPKHKRTIKFRASSNKYYSSFLELPESYVVYLPGLDGFIVDSELNYFYFGALTCLNGFKPKNIYEYVDWYWSSIFLGNYKIKFNPANLCKLFWQGESFHFLYIKKKKPLKVFSCSFCQDWNENRLNNFVEINK